MNEFDTIQAYFSKLTQNRAEAESLKDDAAILSIPEGHELIISTDTLNAGTHFMLDSTAKDIAHKALRMNVSDIAAMGAEPYCYQLSIAFPERPTQDWLKGFTDTLLANQEEFGIFCSGGDTTTINGPLSISISAMGLVKTGTAVKRSGAKPGDFIVLSGPIGDAYIGLKALQGEITSDHSDYFIDKYYRPRPRLDLTEKVQAYANAAIDISDGLLADLEHVCDASGVSAKIKLEDIAFSPQSKDTPYLPEQLITGGDDYELILAVPQEHIDEFKELHIIGTFGTGAGVTLLDADLKPIDIKHTGWSHF